MTVYGISGILPWSDMLVFIPLIEIVLVAVPLTPGGVGIREALLATLFAQLGLTAEQTGVFVAMGILGMALRAVGGLPFMLRAGWRRDPAAPPGE